MSNAKIKKTEELCIQAALASRTQHGLNKIWARSMAQATVRRQPAPLREAGE